MVGTKLNLLKQEIEQYIGLPYSKNVIKDGKVIKEQFLGGKGNWKDLKNATQKNALIEKVDLKKLTQKQIYNFQKKHHLGIDCSGLVVQLLIFYGNLTNKKIDLNPRKTSANILTSPPLSKQITDFNLIQTGDLVRQKNGHHVLFIIKKQRNIISYVESSFKGRGVKYGKFDLNNQTFDNQGIYRLLFLN